MIYIREYVPPPLPPPPKTIRNNNNCLKIFISIGIIVAVIFIFYFLYVKVIKTNDKKVIDEGESDKGEGDEINNIPLEPFRITEKHRTRLSLLKECMQAYGVKEFPVLQEETENKQNITKISNGKILSISTLEININKGESFEIFKSGFELQEGEYTCISFEIG